MGCVSSIVKQRAPRDLPRVRTIATRYRRFEFMVRSEGGAILRDFKELRRRQRVWVHFARNTRVLAQVSPTAHNAGLLAHPAGPPMRSMSKWVLVAPTVQKPHQIRALFVHAQVRGGIGRTCIATIRGRSTAFPPTENGVAGGRRFPRDLVKRSLPPPRRRTERTPPTAPH